VASPKKAKKLPSVVHVGVVDLSGEQLPPPPENVIKLSFSSSHMRPTKLALLANIRLGWIFFQGLI
jgi:hypothetical protein